MSAGPPTWVNLLALAVSLVLLGRALLTLRRGWTASSIRRRRKP